MFAKIFIYSESKVEGRYVGQEKMTRANEKIHDPGEICLLHEFADRGFH